MESVHIPSADNGARTRDGHVGTRALLLSGILSSLLYVAMNVFIPMRWTDYSAVSQTVSELSAVGAPTRSLWVALATIYSLLYAAFGWGVWLSAQRDRRLRIVGALTIAQGVTSLFWPPMHLRGAAFSPTDAMHIVFAMITLLLMLLTIGFGARAFGTRFHRYSIATILVFVVFGALTGMEGPAIAKNLPTPWIGVWERINIAAFMLWVIVLSSAILRRRSVEFAKSLN